MSCSAASTQFESLDPISDARHNLASARDSTMCLSGFEIKSDPESTGKNHVRTKEPRSIQTLELRRPSCARRSSDRRPTGRPSGSSVCRISAVARATGVKWAHAHRSPRPAGAGQRQHLHDERGRLLAHARVACDERLEAQLDAKSRRARECGVEVDVIHASLGFTWQA